MNGIGQSQFDAFLTFSDLHLFQISMRGNLLSFRPKHKKFLGWNSTNHHLFNFTEHFLQPNHLTLKLFLEIVSEREYTYDYFLWKGIDNQVSFPLPTFVRLTASEGNQKNILFFVKNPENVQQISIPFPDKKYVYQAKGIPGLIHNINGPFGTITGRIELLQYKHPEIKEFDEIIRVGYRVQSIMDNVSFKIVSENLKNDASINLNRLLREEISFLNSDLFFKHQVEKVEELANNIPEFVANYLSYSGIFSECYHFFRQFINEHREYVFITKSFHRGSQAGFSVDFLGEFNAQGKLGGELPVYFEGDYIEMIRFKKPGLDNRFLSHCMEKNQGMLSINGTREALKYRIEFPIPSK